ncbi:xanthine dehydrogenase family protein molybdopterin-binding subunit [Corallococcus terminator]|uniref:Xanthine dehydrogenase family protein molybdopterin-binding subunit n=1 Tax=Corallococcus terminator TaxID=2316733 RepID=A0A3A8J093_9BACT|nr:xanthine dehydrogenase family protein molybdopterin-binding subunit [Corallococcus terminator]RKG89147.1 xanthine dehydrogenase family protein molybdopterin-binding subunit [Corallococcus terminator]
MDTSVGKPLGRVDGRLKVTGGAKYSAEMPEEGVVHAVIVGSTIATGSIVSVDVKAAKAQPGVLAVLTPDDAPKLAADPVKKQSPTDMVVHALQSRKVQYQNQPVALVVADTLERATYAAALVKVKYRAGKPKVDVKAEQPRAYKPKQINGKPADMDQGKASTDKAAATVDATYVTPYEHHNPMEPHATLALWEGETLTVYDTTQGVFGTRARLAALFGIPPESVRVVCKFVGGGFGSKGSPWSHVVLAALAAKAVKKPVKLVLRREQMFSQVGFRPETQQRLQLQAREDGKLLLVKHDTVSCTSEFDEFVEPSGKSTRMLYASDRITTSHRLVRLSVGTPTFMRAPGEASGTFALESALDELAVKLKMDPVALRLKNHADKDPETGHPWSSKSLKECYRVAGDRFGWAKRDPTPGSMKDGRTLLGWGMATATYPTLRSKASAKATLLPDGTARVLAGSHDLGTGTYTVMTQVAADALGLVPAKVKFDLGDTRMPETPVSGGSQTAASVGSAVKKASLALRDKAIALAVADPGAPLHGVPAAQVTVENGVLVSGGKREDFAALLKRKGLASLDAEASAEAGPEKDQYAMHAFGTHFVEVRVDPDLGEVRVSRCVGAFGVGTVLNAKTARSQLLGGIVMGIGMALMEETYLDPRSARFMTQDLADYHVPVNPDVPDIDIIFVPESDPHVNELGAKGIGEIGITGVTAAIANAIHHATGRRIRSLPLTLDKVLATS